MNERALGPLQWEETVVPGGNPRAWVGGPDTYPTPALITDLVDTAQCSNPLGYPIW